MNIKKFLHHWTAGVRIAKSRTAQGLREPLPTQAHGSCRLHSSGVAGKEFSGFAGANRS